MSPVETLLVLPQEQRNRLIHEKARLRVGRPLYWVRVYLDELDDAELARDSDTTRLLAVKLPLLIVRCGFQIPDDAGWIAATLQFSAPRWVRRGIDRLVELDRILRIAGKLPENGDQVALFDDLDRRTAERSDPDQKPIRTRSEADQIPISGPSDPPLTAPLATQPRGLEPQPASQAASQRLVTNRAEQRRTSSTSNATEARPPARPALPLTRETQIPETLRRLTERVATDLQSAGIVHAYAAGLPESAIARALESYLTRRPRPTNPAGYVVATLRTLRAEHGLEPVASIRREPEL